MLAAAEQHNYRPDLRARGLAIGRTHSIGHIIPVSQQHEMVNPVFADFIAGAGDVYSRAGYDMRLSVVRPDKELATYRELAARRSVDGVMVHGPRLNDPRIPLLRDLGLPFVVHGRADEVDGDYSWLDVNNDGAFARATDLLLDLGHERIGLVNGLEEMTFAARRRRGYEASLRARGIEPDPALVASSEMTEPYGYHCVKDMLRMDRPPSAFVVASVVSAIGARRAIHESGYRIGRDVSVVTFDDELSYMRDDQAVPSFTATRSSVRAAGVRCAQLLLEQIDDPGCPPRTELWESQLVLGKSTGPRLRAAANG